MPARYLRVPLDHGRTTCPVCRAENNHRTGQVCQHVSKVTAGRVAYYDTATPSPELLTHRPPLATGE